MSTCGAACGPCCEPKVVPNREAFPVGTIMTIEKHLVIDAGHLLTNPELTPEENKQFFGHCNGLHGHTLDVYVFIEGPIQPKCFMVINLDLVKAKVTEIATALDHYGMQDVLNYSTDDSKLYRAPATLEHCAYWIYHELAPHVKALNAGSHLKKVKVLSRNRAVTYKPQV